MRSDDEEDGEEAPKDAPIFTHEPSFDAQEAPDRVYRSPEGDLYKVKVRTKTDAEIPPRAPRLGFAYLRISASQCGEDGKALPFEGGPNDRAIGRGINVTVSASEDADVASDIEQGRLAALAKARAQVINQAKIAAALNQSAPSA